VNTLSQNMSRQVVQRGVRVRTVVFGLVALAVSVTVLVSTLTSVRVDSGIVTLVVLLGAGAALLGAGIAAAVKESRGGPGA
jgi:hypothetical protein